ncbi:MAG: type II and III secretion system protein family protein [Rhodospirillaceae bacterium]|nr:type II and III secretion system protein family protein [Rhodospirillaceae bacterium]
MRAFHRLDDLRLAGVQAVLVAALAAVWLASFVAPAAAQNVEVLAGEETTLVLSAGEGRLLRLERPILRVLLADDTIANAQVNNISPSERLLWVSGLAVGETNALILDYDENLMASLRIIVRQNLAPVADAIRQIDSASDVQLTALGNDTLILTGEVESPDVVDDIVRVASQFVENSDALINRTRVTGPTQINLRIRVAEVSRTYSRDLGLDVESAFDVGEFSFFIAPGLPQLADAAFGAGNNALAGFQSGNVDALLQALESENLAVVLAEPNLTTISGQPASFFAGSEIPIIQVTAEGEIGVELEEVGVSVGFTPVIVSGNRINMQVAVSVRSPLGTEALGGGLTSPSFTSRQAETNVELGSGQSFAIAGLFQVLENDMSLDRIPGLADIPILGQLFQSEEFENSETELVIVVTPYLVRPVNPQDVVLPTQRLTTPVDQDTGDVLMGTYPEPAVLSGPDVNGAFSGGRRGPFAGFILN